MLHFEVFIYDLLDVRISTYIHSGIMHTTPYNTQACMYVCVYNMLHMVGTHSPSVSSGSGVFSLPEEGRIFTQYRPYLYICT